MQQIHHRGNLDLDEDDYFAIIEGKTAELTAVSCRLGAAYAGAAESTVAALDRYGRIWASPFRSPTTCSISGARSGVTGKSLGTDLEKQKLTLPIIHLLKSADPADAVPIRGLLTEAILSSGDGSGPSREDAVPRICLAVCQAARQAGGRRNRLPGGLRGQGRPAAPDAYVVRRVSPEPHCSERASSQALLRHE